MKLINEKTIVSACTLAASLASYYYAKSAEKDVMPFVMVGGFLGAMVGEAISGIVLDKEDKK